MPLTSPVRAKAAIVDICCLLLDAGIAETTCGCAAAKNDGEVADVDGGSAADDDKDGLDAFVMVGPVADGCDGMAIPNLMVIPKTHTTQIGNTGKASVSEGGGEWVSGFVCRRRDTSSFAGGMDVLAASRALVRVKRGPQRSNYFVQAKIVPEST